MRYGYASVYRNLKTGIVLVQRFSKHPIGAEAEVGPPIQIPALEVPSRLSDEVRAALDAYGTLKYDDADAIRRAKERGRQFAAEHTHVSIQRTEDGVISIVPTTRTRGGSIGFSKHKVQLGPDDAGRIGGVILEALKMAASSGLFRSKKNSRD